MNYVLAVSGGVDSMVLMDALAMPLRAQEIGGFHGLSLDSSHRKPRIVVAHVNHGIRSDSYLDEQLVSEAAKNYNFIFEMTRLNLGSSVSEDRARQSRYSFLKQCCRKYNANLITAHHSDDVVETILINLIRGTGWRGLAPMSRDIDEAIETKGYSGSSLNFFTSHIIRPLLNISKKDIYSYAKKFDITWREDSTNSSEDYMRNYIRNSLIPKMTKIDSISISDLLDLSKRVANIRSQISEELKSIIDEYRMPSGGYIIPRYSLIMAGDTASREIIYKILTTLEPNWHPSKKHINRALTSAKVARQGSRLVISKNLIADISNREIEFKKL